MQSHGGVGAVGSCESFLSFLIYGDNPMRDLTGFISLQLLKWNQALAFTIYYRLAHQFPFKQKSI